MSGKKLSAEDVAAIKAKLAELNWGAAFEQCTLMLAEFPDNLFLLATAHKAAVQTGQFDEARRLIGAALLLAPDVAAYHLLGARLDQKLGEFAAALAGYQRAAAVQPEVATYHASLAACHYALEQYAEATHGYRAALALDPSQVGWWNRLARGATLIGQLDVAAEAYGESMKLKEDFAVLAALMEVQRQQAPGRGNSHEAASAYYDAIFAQSPKYARHGTDTEYASVWENIAEKLRQAGVGQVLDLGCGPGQFAEFLHERAPGLSYVGVDFSDTAIVQARARCPDYRFERTILPDAKVCAEFASDAVVCTEVLEHIQDDIAVLASISAGTLVLGTVPNFDSFGHVRIFRRREDVSQRYAHLFDALTVEPIALSASATIWLLSGRRNSAPVWADGERGRAGAVQPAKTDLPDLMTESSGASAGAVPRHFACLHEAVLWTDGTRYVEELLPSFGLPFCTVLESLSVTTPHVALRHDVDWSIENAMAMATLEAQHNIRSTYFLLHPDGQYSPSNYFGHVSGDQLHINPEVYSSANRLMEMGHEVALHNDLITLGLNTGRQPAEFLEQILSSFSRHGIELRGSVAHGSRRCREDGYLNYQIFKGYEGKVFREYMNSPDHERFLATSVSAGDRRVEKFTIDMADYGLAYEANFAPYGLYLSDSSARWFFLQNDQSTYLDKFAPRTAMQTLLRELIAKTEAGANIQCLVHSCHWSSLANFNPAALGAVKKRRDAAHNAQLLVSKAAQLSKRPNVVYAETSARFDVYDAKYGSTEQLYSIAPSVAKFVGEMLTARGAAISSVLELGCGQGDFLEFIRVLLTRGAAGKQLTCVGIDGSIEGVGACAERYTDSSWIAGSVEDFLDKFDAGQIPQGKLPASFDLVVDKTGTVFISDYEVARRMIKSIHQALSPGGQYLYIASRHYYETDLLTRVYCGWPTDWMSLLEKTFASVEVFDDVSAGGKGYFKRIYTKNENA